MCGCKVVEMVVVIMVVVEVVVLMNFVIDGVGVVDFFGVR